MSLGKYSAQYRRRPHAGTPATEAFREQVAHAVRTMLGLRTMVEVVAPGTYTPADIAGTPFEDIGLPGRYPFTRGPYPTMYRSRTWTMRQTQYRINIVRTAIQALSAVLGGAQSLHTNGMDEAFSIPTEEAMKIALRTQQILAEEAHVTEVVDPLGGSYYLEHLTTEYERKIFEIIAEVDANGGTVKLIEEGWFQRHIADFAYEQALNKQSGDKPVIGVNIYQEPDAVPDLATHPHDPTAERRQIERLQRIRRERDNAKVAALLERLVEVARDDTQNIMLVTIELVQAGASMGDIVERLKTLWGTYREVPVFWARPGCA